MVACLDARNSLKLFDQASNFLQLFSFLDCKIRMITGLLVKSDWSLCLSWFSKIYISKAHAIMVWHITYVTFFSDRQAAMKKGLKSKSRPYVLCHCEFLEYWNTQKSVWRIWQHFSCQANSAHLAAHFCLALVCPQKATVRIQFLLHFLNPLIK